ncbi:3-oxo-5-alpha-steroid 4-dehydrogenase-domain-containing protein [Gautieria morchelliformis]|nr:3-oxo-5-alpha-steroid 4-dehydrogenase-domain-containing protein [Gautieria morchelliformis]
MNVTVSARGKPPKIARSLPISLELPKQDATVGDVKRAIAKKFPKFHPDRQKLSLKSDNTNKALDEQTTLTKLGITTGGELVVKDLGPQISWKLVFLVEYAGPLIIHPLFYHFPAIFYGRNFEHSQLQKFTYAMVMAHFVKRELETLFVHRFSHATMPFSNIFKNSAHYHLGSGLALAWAIYTPAYSSRKLAGTIRDNTNFIWAMTGFWALAEIFNLQSHIALRNLRPPGTTTRAIPRGFGFNLVSCPNYLWEILSWTAIAIMTNNVFAYAFLALSTGQMFLWALKKHRAYKREFGKEYPRERKALFPFFI